MKKCSRFLMLLIAAVMLHSLCTPAAASQHYVPDLTKRGSVLVTVRDSEGNGVPGGTLTLYHVARVHEDDGDFTFAYTPAFADCDYPLDELNSGGLADKIAQYVTAKKVTGTTVTVDKDGVAAFDNLELGLYLVVQTKAASKHTALKPFLVTVPTQTGDGLVYNVNAAPKSGTVEETKPPHTPHKPHTSGKLPQTGQLWWPVPVMAMLGLLLIAFGWKRRCNEKN